MRTLGREGYKVRAFVRKKTKFAGDVELVFGDLRDYDSLLKATRDVYAVIHLAAAKSDEKDSYEINVLGTKNLIEAAEENNAKRIINVSTMSTKIENKGVYAKTKDLADNILRKSKIPFTILKPSVVYGDTESGVFGSLVRFAKLPITPLIGSGKAVLRPIHVDDLAKTISIAISSQKTINREYDVGGPEEISFDGLVRRIARDVLNKKTVRIVHLPKSIGFAVASVLSAFFRKAPITKSNILGSTQETKMNVEKYFADFNFNPRKLGDGLSELREKVFDEARLIARYVSCSKLEIPDEIIDRYNKVILARGINKRRLSNLIHKTPFLLGFLDAISRLAYPRGILQNKLNIAAALIESSPESANWLLPKDRPLVEALALAARDIFRSSIKLCGGIVIYIISPNFLKKNAK